MVCSKIPYIQSSYVYFMKILTRFIASSIGKKSIMALSGSLMSLFLLVHLVGNSTMFFGRDSFNSYAEHLHSLGIILHIFEAGLVFIFLIHIITGTLLYIENLQSRPSRYSVSTTAGGRTWGSRTMPYTGIIILLFLVVHLINFQTLENIMPSEAVKQVLSRPMYAAFYTVSLVALAFHLSHGWWSLFQSLGINHPNYNRTLNIGALVLSIIVGFIFILFPTLTSIFDQFLLL